MGAAYQTCEEERDETEMSIQDSQSHMQIQIEMAAKGCISGTGAEWPHLLHALRHYGERAHKEMGALTLRTAARRVCTKQGWLR